MWASSFQVCERISSYRGRAKTRPERWPVCRDLWAGGRAHGLYRNEPERRTHTCWYLAFAMRVGNSTITP